MIEPSLAANLQSGSEGSDPWTFLVREVRQFVGRRISVPADVDDVVQEVLLRLQKNIGQVQDETRFGPWVYQVVRSAIADHYRARGRHQKHEVTCEDGTCISHDHAGEDSLDAREDANDEHSIENVLASLMPMFVEMLDEPYRSAVALTELEGLLHKDAAERLGVSLSAMKSRVLRGRALLREKIEQSVALGLDARGGVVSCEGKGEFVCPCDE